MTRYPTGLGTTAGILVILPGIIYAIWVIADINQDFPITDVFGREYAVRQFIKIVLDWSQRGMLLVLVAEASRRLVRLR